MSQHPIRAPRKLIEVALPLDAINTAAAREKSIRHGHPSTLHLWWARRPLAAARAVIFAQLVNDPASLWELQNPGQTPSDQQRGGFTRRRNNLFKLIRELVKWENTTNDKVLDEAREEIRRSWREVCELNKDHPEAATLFHPEKMPGLHDPFAGGGTIPLEAQRLGLDAYASDLNPVAVLINKAMIEIPPKFAGREPVNPEWQNKSTQEKALRTWKGAQGLAEDVRYYGKWMRDEAEKRIGHLYPKVEITAEMARERPDLQGLVGQKLTVIAWLWARTVKSPNPAFSHVDVPLVSSFLLGTKEGKEAWVEPIVEGDQYRFVVRMGKPSKGAKEGTKASGRGSNFRCILSGTAIDGDYIKTEGQAGRMGARLMAIVAEGARSRVYIEPLLEHESVAVSAQPTWRPSGDVPARLTGGTCVPYGLRHWGDLFTLRQLVALTTFSDLVVEGRDRAALDAALPGSIENRTGLKVGAFNATEYGDATAGYLAFLVDQLANHSSSICGWNHPNTQMRSVFSRQALPMTWDYAEANVFSESSGSFNNLWERQVKGFDALGIGREGLAYQANATTAGVPTKAFISTDPPYYDNIAYADLSDFFYVWLRRTLLSMFPILFAGISVPKSEELVATPHRHGSKQKAEAFFLDGMTNAIKSLSLRAHPSAPITIYYAFKQSETGESAATSSTGWETFLDAVLRAGLSVGGTWPIRTEKTGRSIGIGTNSLASSIVLVCRRRLETAATISRREFLRELNVVLPEALDLMTKGSGEEQSPVAPVDLSQAIIGPGMAVFSKYAAVLEADGTRMSVKTALQLINRFLAEDDFDADTQFCLHWFEQHGWEEGVYGDADVLARSKATSVGGLVEAGVLVSSGGKARLLRPAEYPADWDPRTDKRLPVWEALHHLVRVFRKDGEGGAGWVLAAVQSKTEAIRQLGYRLYTLCERHKWAEDARAYNELISAWSGVEIAASAVPEPEKQLEFDM